MTQPPKDDPIELTPEAREQLDEITEQHPEAAQAFTEMFDTMRKAHAAWQAGHYPSFDEAVQDLMNRGQLH